MLQVLRQPKWIVAALVVTALAAVFVRLGFWQLDRLEERREMNEVGAERINAEPVGLAELMAEAEGSLESIQFRRVEVSGIFAAEDEILIRSQVELGQAGFHVITPLVQDDGRAILINRGWVPLSMDAPPVTAQPSAGHSVVEGWVQLTQTRPSLGPEDAPGDQQVFNRVDIARIGDQMPYDLAPVYVVEMGERRDELPVRVDPPGFDDEGTHLAYAVQWFGCAAVGLVGFFFLIRRKGPSDSSERPRRR